MKQCPNCYTPNEDYSPVCKSCGYSLESVAVQDEDELTTTLLDPMSGGNGGGYNPQPQPQTFDPYQPAGPAGYPGGYPEPQPQPYIPPQPNPMPNPAPQKPKKKKTGIYITIGVIVALIIAGVCAWFFFFKDTPADDPTPTPTTETSISSEVGPVFKPGTYKARVGLHIRTSPDSSTSVSSELAKGSIVEITDVMEMKNNTIWGKIGSDQWICMSDKSKVYVVSVQD